MAYPIAHAWEILIVDDERPARSELMRMLRRTAPDARVREAGSVKEALGGIAEGMPDLLFLDIQMPGGDDFELLDHLGKKRPPFDFTTAYG
jgi:two-component system LytT family response regulator